MLGSSSCHLVQNNPVTPSGPPWSGRWPWSVPPRPQPGWASVAATSPAWPAPARFPRCAPAPTTTTSRPMWRCRSGPVPRVGQAWPIARRMRASAWRAIGRARRQRQQHTTSGGRRAGLLPHAADNGPFSWICPSWSPRPFPRAWLVCYARRSAALAARARGPHRERDQRSIGPPGISGRSTFAPLSDHSVAARPTGRLQPSMQSSRHPLRWRSGPRPWHAITSALASPSRGSDVPPP